MAPAMLVLRPSTNAPAALFRQDENCTTTSGGDTYCGGGGGGSRRGGIGTVQGGSAQIGLSACAAPASAKHPARIDTVNLFILTFDIASPSHASSETVGFAIDDCRSRRSSPRCEGAVHGGSVDRVRDPMSRVGRREVRDARLLALPSGRGGRARAGRTSAVRA